MIIVLIIAVLVAIFDQITKIIVSSKMNLFDSIVVIKDFAFFTYCRNDGIAWSMEAKLWVLIIITLFAIGLFVYLSLKLKFKDDKWYIFTLGFMLGGTLGNFLDRLFQKDHCVIDFLDFYLYYPSFKNGLHFEIYDFPIFNVADSFLVVGAIMFIIYVLFIEPKKIKNKENNETKEEVIDIKNE